MSQRMKRKVELCQILHFYANTEKLRLNALIDYSTRFRYRIEALKRKKRIAFIREQRRKERIERAMRNMPIEYLDYLEGRCLGDSYL